MAERVAEIGYINDAQEHVLISIFDPALLNAANRPDKFVQVGITIESAIALRARLDTFLAVHDRTLNRDEASMAGISREKFTADFEQDTRFHRASEVPVAVTVRGNRPAHLTRNSR